MATLGPHLPSRRATPALAALVALTLFVAPARAGLIIDQEQDLSGGFGSSITFFAPIGQEFTPTLGALSFVDLFFEDVGGSSGVEVVVNIRELSITGTILGTSTLRSLPDGFDGEARFLFASDVPLTPGVLHVIEVEHVLGDSFHLRGAGPISNPNPYSGGSFIGLGTPNAQLDAFFRTGLDVSVTAVPEPSTLTMAACGGLIGFGAWLRTRRRASA